MKNDYLLQIMKDSGLYHVDDLGQVWTCKKLSHGTYDDRWRRAETVPAPKYRQVRHSQKLVYAHRFVYFWFKGPIPYGIEVDHVDGNGLHNHPLNLQLLTRLQNQQKAEQQCNIKRLPTDNRKSAIRTWWLQPGVRDKMSLAAKRGWENRRTRLG